MPELSTLLAALWDDAVGAAVISVAIVVLFVGAEVARRTANLPTEWTRKGTHVGAGVVVLAFPWLVSHTVTVVALALAFAGILAGGKVTGLLGSIHDVERRTGGAYYYPFAVLLAWILSGGEPLLFCVPLAVMAVADTGAALVGQRAGETTFQVMDGQRSLEGSVAFFALAFAVTLTGCAIAGRPGWPEVLLVTLVVAGLTTSVEAVSVRGSDNLFIPYAAWMALDHTQRLGLDALGDWILGMALGVGLLMATGAQGRLTTASGVVVFLVTTLATALGGPAWVLPLATLYALWLLVRRASQVTELDMVFPTTAGSMVVLLWYAHTNDPAVYLAFLTTVGANGAMAAALLLPRSWARPTAVLAGAAIPVLSARLVQPDAPILLPLAGSIGAVVMLPMLTWSGVVGRRLFASVACGVATWWLAT